MMCTMCTLWVGEFKPYEQRKLPQWTQRTPDLKGRGGRDRDKHPAFILSLKLPWRSAWLNFETQGLNQQTFYEMRLWVFKINYQ